MAALLACGPVYAGEDQDRARRAVEEGRILPLSQIVSRVEHEHSGQLIEAELEDEGGAMVYEIKMLTAEGRLVKLFYGARTGEPVPHRERGDRR